MTTPFYYISILYYIIQLSESIDCFHRNSLATNTTSCEGDYCIVFQLTEKGQYGFIQDCSSGIALTTGCFLNYDDIVQCICNSTFCNFPLLTREAAPPLEKQVSCMKTGKGSVDYCVSNECRLYLSKFAPILNDTTPNQREERSCPLVDIISGFEIQYMDFSYDSLDGQFFLNACYNISTGIEDWVYTCRCNTNDCNENYEVLVSSAVECQQNSFYVENYDDMQFNSTCHGDLCFLFVDVVDRWYLEDLSKRYQKIYKKGCVTLKEFGVLHLVPGHYHLRNADWYFCNEKLCNSNLKSAIRSYETVNSKAAPAASLQKL